MIFRSPPERTGPDRPTSPDGDLAAVADALLSSASGPAAVGTPGGAPNREGRPGPSAVARRESAEASVPEAAPPRGLYVLVPAGVAPTARREAALSAAGRLAARRRPAGVLLVEAGRVDAHVLGETACGRLGPQNYFGGADLAQTVRRLAHHCDPIALVPLDSPDAVLGLLRSFPRGGSPDSPRQGETAVFGAGGLPRLRSGQAPTHRAEWPRSVAGPGWCGSVLDRPVFVAEADAEGLVEAYRALKAWRRRGAAGRSAVLFAGGRQADADPLHARLRQAARAFLGCDLARQRTETTGAGAPGTGGVRLFAGAPAEAVWPPLLAAAAGRASTPDAEVSVPTDAEPDAELDAETEAGPPAADREADVRPAARPAFALWHPESRHALLEVLEAQLPALLGRRFRHVFRVDVAEPDAPPLVAVRDDGTLVAILFGEPDEVVPTKPARAWVRVHWPLLARICCGTVLGDEPKVAATVLASARPRQPDGGEVRRFVPVRLGGRKGIVLLP